MVNNGGNHVFFRLFTYFGSNDIFNVILEGENSLSATSYTYDGKVKKPTVTVKNASGTKLTNGTKKLTVKWAKKTTQVTGYQIQYSTSKSFSSVKTKTVTKNSTTSTALTGLKAKITYYVRVRTYKTVNGVKYYSGWTTVKSAKTK